MGEAAPIRVVCATQRTNSTSGRLERSEALLKIADTSDAERVARSTLGTSKRVQDALRLKRLSV